MAKWLLIGDPHVVTDELKDCQALAQGIEDTIKAHPDLDYVVFLGDQHHNHALMHVEVLAFWRETFKRLKTLRPTVYALVGNHDQPGDGVSRNHAMMAYEDLVTVVDRPKITSGVLLLPYYHDQKQFLEALEGSRSRLVICHQTLDGSKYENGFYAKDGVPMAGLEDWHFISGHIHTPQAFGNVTYIGAPRWRSLSDANVDRSLVIMELTPGLPPEILSKIDTGEWCSRLIHIVDKQDNPVHIDVDPRHRYIVDLHGESGFIQAKKHFWHGCRIRTFQTQDETPAVRESMGINQAIQAFIETYQPKYGTEITILRDMATKRIS